MSDIQAIESTQSYSFTSGNQFPNNMNSITIPTDYSTFNQTVMSGAINTLTQRTRYLFNWLKYLQIPQTNGLIYFSQGSNYSDVLNSKTDTNWVYHQCQSFTWDNGNSLGSFVQFTYPLKIADFSSNPINYNNYNELLFEVSFDADNYQSYQYDSDYTIVEFPNTVFLANYILAIQFVGDPNIYGIQRIYKPQVNAIVHCDFCCPFPSDLEGAYNVYTGGSWIYTSNKQSFINIDLNGVQQRCHITFPSSGQIQAMYLAINLGSPFDINNDIIPGLRGLNYKIKIFNTGNGSNAIFNTP